MLRRQVDHLSCLVEGSGPVVVLLHGLAGSAQEMIVSLPGHLTIAPDQRGHGQSIRRPEDLSREAYVRDVLTVVDAFADEGERVALVGQSMGAHTAMLVAAWHPERVSSLIMLEGGVGGSEDDYPARLGRWFASWPVPFPSREAAVAFLGPGPLAEAWAQDLEERGDGLWPRFDPDVMEAAIRGVAETARWTEWESIRTPTLIVRGSQSRLDDKELAHMLALRPDVAVVTIPESGHDAHLDQPKAWRDLLRRALL